MSLLHTYDLWHVCRSIYYNYAKSNKMVCASWQEACFQRNQRVGMRTKKHCCIYMCNYSTCACGT